MAVGAAVGLALPETRREQELMGDARDRVVDNAKSMASSAVDRATEAAQHIVGTAKDASDTASSSAYTAQDAISRASQAAKDTHQQGVTTAPGRAGPRRYICRARAASARTALTIPISPMPLPIEMFCRKICSTISGDDRLDLSGVSPDSVFCRIAASALADTPDGFSTAKCSVQRPVRILHRPRVRIRLALRAPGATCRTAAARPPAAPP